MGMTKQLTAFWANLNSTVASGKMLRMRDTYSTSAINKTVS